MVFIEDLPQYIPFIAKADGDGICKNRIYVRRGTSTEEANYEELQEIFNRRLETEYSSRAEFDFDKHLAELNMLYKYVPRYHNIWEELGLSFVVHKLNPNYPQEDFEAFIKRMIGEKKKIIQSIVLKK